MEHRWGERVGVDIPVRISAHPFAMKHAQLTDMSVSGASLETDLDLRVLSRIHLLIEVPHRIRSEASSVAAYVTRRGKSGVGIEWCEFAPPVVSELLATQVTRRYRRPRKSATVVNWISRLSTPLLKHGM